MGEHPSAATWASVVARGVVVLVVVLGWPEDAHACKCAPWPSFMLPRDGATGVPTNARVLLTNFYVMTAHAAVVSTTPRFELLPALGERVAVPASLETTSASSYVKLYVLTPRRALAPDTRYDVVLADAEDAALTVGSFTTGAAADVTPPRFSGVTALDAGAGPARDHGTCARRTGGYSEITWDHGVAADDVSPEGDLAYLVYVWKKDGKRSLRLAAPGSAEARHRADDSLCSPIHPDLRAGAEVCLSVEAVDLAGNAAGGAAKICRKARKLPAEAP